MSSIFQSSARSRACPSLAWVLLLSLLSVPASANPGSGSASLLPAGPVAAGTTGTWTVDFRAAEDFQPPDGGVVGFVIPASWTPPSIDPIVGPGHVIVTGPAGTIDSVRIDGMAVWVYGGSVPGMHIRAGDHIVLEYGAPLPAGQAQAQTTPGLATFLVLSDPDGGAPAPLTSGSPELDVTPAAPEELHFIPSSLALQAGAPAPIRLEARDRFGNPSPVATAQLISLTAATPSFAFLLDGAPVSEAELAADSSGIGLAVSETALGSVTFRAADGDAAPPALLPALGHATVTHGPPAALVVSGILNPIVAGELSSVTVEVVDAYGNRATSYGGTVTFASTDSGPDTELPAPYTFLPADAGRHVFAGEVVLTIAGQQSVSVEDDADPQLSGEQSGIVVAAAETAGFGVSGVLDPVPAGAASDVEVEAQDRFGNRAESYFGTVHFTSDDPHPGTTLPPDYTFSGSEAGIHRFASGVVLMTAGGRNVTASDLDAPAISGAQPGIDVTAGPAAAAVFTPAGTAPVTAGATQVVVLTVTDAAGNPVSGEPTTIAILDSADGALAPDPGHPGGTYGTATVQSGATDASGALTVRYVAPTGSGVSDRLGAWTATLPAGAIEELQLTIVADGATRLAVTAPVLADTAFAAFALTIVAEDTYGNPDPGATPLVRLTAGSPSARFSIDGGGSWSQGPSDSLQLSAGTSGNQVRVRDTATGALDVVAADPAGFLSPASLELAVGAAPPAGSIPLLVLPDTLTADGRSEAQVLGGPVSDRYSNPVAGFPVTVSVSAGEVRGVDEDPQPGVQRRTDTDGRFTAGVRAADTPAQAQLIADTGPGGTAAGSVPVTFLPRSHFALASLAPPSAVPGDGVTFQVTVVNLGPSAVAFGGGTVFRLLDPDGSSLATTLSGPIVVGAGAAGDLLFQPVTIDTALAPGRYTPLIRLAGTDAHGATVDTLIAAPFESFAIEVLAIESVLAPARVSRGQVGVEVRIGARNRGASSLLVTDLGLDFSQPAYQVGNPSPPLPHALGPGAQTTYTVLVAVDPLAVLGPVAIDARLEYEAGGSPRLAQGAASPTQWTVDQAADLDYLAGSLAPRVVSVGQTHETAVVVVNQGGAGVVLDPALTRLEVGTPPLSTPLATPVVVPGQGSALLRFADLAIPGGYPLGPAAVALTLGGLENGAPYTAALPLADSITIEAAATLAVLPGSLAPDSVAIGQSRSFSLMIANNGGADVIVQAATRLRLTGSGGSLELDLAAAPITIPAAGQRAVDFGPAVIPPELGPGLATAEVVAEIQENGLPGSRLVPVPDLIVVELPSALRFVAQSLGPARVTRGEPAVFSLTLANDGQASVAIQAGSRFEVSDGVHELAIVYPGPTFSIPGSASAPLTLPAAVVPADLAAQSYAPTLELNTVEHGVGGVRTIPAAPGELLVQTPVDARYVPGTMTPDLATAGQVVAFQVEIENRGEATLLPDPTTRFEFGGFTALLDVARSPAIAGGATDTLFFLPESLASAETGVFAPQVDLTGTDANGAAVSVSLPLAPDAITIVRGAALRLERLASTAPRGARVNRGQSLGLAVTVVNRGEEAVSGGTLDLAGPGLAAPVSAPVGALAPGDSAALLLAGVAGAAPGMAVVTATLTGGVGAISGLPPLVVPALDDTLALAIEREAALRPAIAISAPAGAGDGVASGGSLLDLAVQVANQGDAPIGNEGVVTLGVPAGYGVLGPAAQALVPEVPIHFAVAVPPGGAASDSLRVTISTRPLDLNSGVEAQLLAASAAVAVTAVPPARLDLALAIVEPATAVNGVALPRQEVTVEAVITNQGLAQVVGPGQLRLLLDPALDLAPGEVGDRPFTTGVPVRFRVRAATSPGPPHAIAVQMAEVPPDENTGLMAAVNRDQAEVSLATQVAGADIGGAPLAATARTLDRGGEPAAVLGFTVRNPAPAGESQVLVFESIVPALLRMAVVGGGPRHAELGVEGTVAPESVLGRLELHRDRADGAIAAVWDAAAGGPVRLALTDTIGAQETRSYVLLVAPAEGAPGGSYAVDLGANGVFGLRDIRAGVPVTAAIAGGELRSAVFTLFESVQVIPNPFAPERETAAIAYVLGGDAPVAIEIFTLLGDRVWSRSISAGEAGGRAGLNEVAWDGRNTAGQAVRNGVYHCRIRGGDLDRMVKIAAIR